LKEGGQKCEVSVFADFARAVAVHDFEDVRYTIHGKPKPVFRKRAQLKSYIERRSRDSAFHTWLVTNMPVMGC